MTMTGGISAKTIARLGRLTIASMEAIRVNARSLIIHHSNNNIKTTKVTTAGFRRRVGMMENMMAIVDCLAIIHCHTIATRIIVDMSVTVEIAITVSDVGIMARFMTGGVKMFNIMNRS